MGLQRIAKRILGSMVVTNGTTNLVEEDLGFLLNNICLSTIEGGEVSLVHELDSSMNSKEELCLLGKALIKKRINLMGFTRAMKLPWKLT